MAEPSRPGERVLEVAARARLRMPAEVAPARSDPFRTTQRETMRRARAPRAQHRLGGCLAGIRAVTLGFLRYAQWFNAPRKFTFTTSLTF